MVFLRDMSYDLGRVKVSLQLFGCHTLTMPGSLVWVEFFVCPENFRKIHLGQWEKMGMKAY